MHKSVFQTDDDGLFLYETVANDLPVARRLQRALWRLSRCAARRQRPLAALDGQWLADGRRPSRHAAMGGGNGESYAIGSKIKLRGGVDDLRYPGWGPLPAWLSDTAPQRPAEGAGV